MWPGLFIVSILALLALQFFWRRRFADAQSSLEQCRRDLSAAQERQAQQLDQTQAFQEELLMSLGEGVLLADRENRVQIANPAFMSLFGLERPIRGLSVTEALRRRELTELVERAAKETQTPPLELEAGSNPPRILEIQAAAILDRQKKLQGTLLLARDLTRLKQLEQMRSEFVANVSHELRTPLSIIKGYLEALLDAENSELSARFLKIVQRHTDRLMFLIEDLLSLSQLESGRISLHPQPVLLRNLTDTILDELRGLAREKKFVLVNEIPQELWAQADLDRTQQILWNLVENAIKHGRSEGYASIGARGLPDSAQVEVWVRDDGPGIPEEAQPRVFERFFRVDRSRSRDQGGTGLGLAIVKHIVQAHGGKVWLESRFGQGATFRFTLPKA